MGRRTTFPLLCVSAALAACTSTNPPPDTSPIATTGVVAGRVQMPATATGAPPVQVTVTGSNATATLNTHGEFALANVPAGPLTLTFTGGAGPASLSLGELAGGEVVTVTVSLTGSGASVLNIARMTGSRATVEGAIDTPALPLPDRTIIVGGRTIVVPAGTAISTASGAPAGAALTPGMRIRIAGDVTAAGIVAREIVIL